VTGERTLGGPVAEEAGQALGARRRGCAQAGIEAGGIGLRMTSARRGCTQQRESG